MQTFREKQKAKSTTKPYTYKAKIVHQKLPYKTAYLQPVRSNIITMKNNDNSPISKGSGRKQQTSKSCVKSEKPSSAITCSFTNIFRKIVDNIGSQSQVTPQKQKKNPFVQDIVPEEVEVSQTTLTTDDNSKSHKKEYRIKINNTDQISHQLLLPKRLKKKQSQKQKDPILLYFNLQHKTIGDKINYHLDVLSILSDFVESWWRSNKDQDEWQELNFLIYKKFYIQRVKVQNFLKKYPIKNPFRFINAHADTKQILGFMKLSTGKIWLKKICTENTEILQKLRDYYNVIIDKSGGHINLLQVDNFSQFLHKELWNCFMMLQFGSSIPQQRRLVKLCRILQIGFIIAQLQGKQISPLQDADVAIKQRRLKQYIDKNRTIYESILIF